MAHKKAAGSAKNLKDSQAKYRGVKLFGGQKAVAGNILIRQNGEKFVAGTNAYQGRDYTIHASVDGVVTFTKKNVKRFDGRTYLKTVVNVVSHQEEKKTVTAAVAKKIAPKAVQKTPVKATAKKTPTKAVAKKTPAKKTAAKKKA